MKDIKCKKCGTMNSPASNYCEHCGAKLYNEIKCPKCGQKQNNKVNFCANCGYDFTKSVSLKPEKIKSNNNVSKILNIVSLGVFGFSLLLMFIGIFGSAFRVVTTSSLSNYKNTVNYGLNYYFHDLWEYMTDSSRTGSAHIFHCFTNVIDFVAYIFMIGGLIYVIAKFSKELLHLKKGEVNVIDLNDYFKILTIILLPQMTLIMINHCFNISFNNGDDFMRSALKYGWGSILIIIGYFFTLAALITSECYQKRKELTSYVIRKVSIILMFFVFIFSFRSTFCLKNSTERIDFGVVEFLKLCYSNQSISGRSCELFGMCALILSILNMLFIISFINLESNPKLKRNFVYPILVLCFSVIIGLFGKYGIWDYYVGISGERVDYSIYPWSSIIGIVLSLVIFILSIISKVYYKKSHRN